jgi:hypothetical protein
VVAPQENISPQGFPMSPEEIRIFIKHEFNELIPDELPSGVGWSFFLGVPRRGRNSNRILRASRSSPGGVTKLKLAASARLHPPQESDASDTAPVEFDFVGSATDLRKHIENELRIYNSYLDQMPK